MPGPPKEISASELWLKLASAERPNKLVDFPRWDENGKSVGQLRVRVLTQEEQMICTKAAEDLCRKMLKDGKRGDLGYERLFTDSLILESLFRACRRAEDASLPAFDLPEAMRTQLTTEECAKLFDHYLTVQLELGPTGLSMSDEECEAWIDRLVEGGSAYPLDLLSSEQQKILALYMALQYRSSQKDRSSVGGPPEDSTTSNSVP